MKKDLTDKEKEERMNYLTIHKCKNEDERKELKELCDWYFKDTPTLTMSFSLTEEDFRVTMERDVELSEVARAVNDRDVLAARNILRKGISELESKSNSSDSNIGVSCVCIQESHLL